MNSKLDRRKFITSATFAGVSLSVTGISFGFNQFENNKLPPLLIDSKDKQITNLKQWKRQREVIKKRWLGYLRPLEPNPDKPVLTVLNEEKSEGIVRQLVEYEGEPGITVWGYLLKSEHIITPAPGIVAMHSTSDNQMIYIAGVKKGKIVPLGFRLAQQGYIVFCPQCFLWHEKGDRKFEEMVAVFQQRHPGSRGMAKMLFDAQRAVDVLASLPLVDPGRIGATGHSLGAKEVFYLGAFDDRVKVIVSNEGGIGIDFSNWDAMWYLGNEIHDFGHQHHEVLALVAPKPFLLIGGDSADGEKSRPYIQAVRPVYKLNGASDERIQLYNHGTGHNIHAEAEKRTYEWIKRFL